jgi:hypothetical protein
MKSRSTRLSVSESNRPPAAVPNTAQSVMAHLSIAEIKALDDRIDSGIAVFAPLSLPKPVMAIHLLRFYEDYLRLYAPKLAGGNVEDYLAARKLAQDGLHFAMLWVMKRCPSSEAVDLSLRDDVYTLCWPLFQGAMQYSHVWDFLTLLFRKRAIAEWESRSCTSSLCRRVSLRIRCCRAARGGARPACPG